MVEFAHTAVVAGMAVHLPNERGDLLVAAAAFGVIGAVMTVLAPAKQAVHTSITGQAIGLYFIGRPATRGDCPRVDDRSEDPSA